MIFVDRTLTPENAPERGYQIIQDIIYYPEEPAETRKPIEIFIVNERYKLGQLATRTATSIFTGLYTPTSTKKNRNP